AGRKPPAVTVEILPLLVPTTQTGLAQRLAAAGVKPRNSAACGAVRGGGKMRPGGGAGGASAIIAFGAGAGKRLAGRIRKLPVESVMVPVASRFSRPLPPVIKTTLARPLCAGLSRRTGGVLTMKFVSMVTASASAARAAGGALQKPNVAHTAKIKAD